MSPQSLLCEHDWVTVLHSYAYNVQCCHVAHAHIQAPTQVETDTECILQELHIRQQACDTSHKLATGSRWAQADCYRHAF